MTPSYRHPFVRFYQALAPMGRWPRWLFIGILLYSLVAMLAIIGYTAIVQPSGKALDAALDNFLALWAIVVIPCAILMLASLLTRSPLRYNWSIRLIGISMIGIFAGTLLVILPLNTVLTLSRSPSAWAGLLLPRAMTLSPLASSFWQRAPTGAIGPRCWRLPSSSPSR